MVGNLHTLMDEITVVGDTAVSTGSYLLCLQVTADLQVRFGRFARGAALPVPAGEYVYVGSAMGGLGTRVLRHASRSQYDNHAIYDALKTRLLAEGLLRAGWRPSPKRLRWHVDYLLEETAVDLTHLLLMRSATRLESDLARWLMAEAATEAIAPGLGASDGTAAGETHLLRVTAGQIAEWEPIFLLAPLVNSSNRLSGFSYTG